MTTGNVTIHDGMDFAEFFWRGYEAKCNDGSPRFAATWCAVSSFGVFGHHWSHMGRPFEQFAQTLGEDYLLSKISQQVFDEAKFLKWIRREIFTARASREVKREAAASLRELRQDYSGESLSVMVYADAAISHCQIDWSDADTRGWDIQAVMFVRKMWPKFTAHLRAAGEVAHV